VRLKKAYAEVLTRARVIRVATADARRVPHVVPVCAVLDAGRLYFGSAEDARKVRNLRANPRVSLVADDYTEAWDGLRGVMVTGAATLHARGPRFRRARQLLYAKYPQYESEAALDEGDSIVVEVTPTRVFAWGFD
jgi:nitroimidazol reductase NimA-like FMN-containing flavoprotein (pyridoxamine 5'-phosphate oxidase superfamily)